ncbi:LOW QUALITY PROTEIN: NAD(P)H-quinone oxidoreductase subunit M [Dillenia turbinata]|uniref:NAD(P)H-quinone oxidoreductase subunit M, chloroplastic n=1 Tax=Dillenia turbinata TaxID=194707 RepID=A0AAN8ZJ92_9MAGN
MAATSSYMASTQFSTVGWIEGKGELTTMGAIFVSAQQQQTDARIRRRANRERSEATEERNNTKPSRATSERSEQEMSGEYGVAQLRYAAPVRIYASYIDPVACATDQTQMDKLTLILDPTNEFVWTSETSNMELVDHYEGAELTEYTLCLIGSDLEHYIRKLLHDGEIKYNMNAQCLNFSMGKPPVTYNVDDDQIQDIQ